MSLRRTWALIRKEFRHVGRDYQILFMVLVAPAFVLFLLAYTFAVDLDQVRIGIMDQDRSPASRHYVAALTADGGMQLAAWCDSYEQIEDTLRRGVAGLVVVIPPGFDADITAGRSTAVQVVLDGSSYHEAATNRQNVEQRTAAWAATQAGAAGSSVAAPILVHTRPLYNLPMNWLHSMTPGLMAMAFCFPAIAVALACTRETEQGSYEGLLSTPMRPIEYLLGKLVPYLVLGALGTLLALALTIWWFRVPFRGSLPDYMLLATVFLLSLLGIGVLIGSTAQSQRLAIIIMVLVFFVPSFFLSGLLIPLVPGSPLEQVLTRVLPAASYVDVNRALFLKGADTAALLPYARNLLRIGGVAFLASLVLARRRVA
jgi:ABC-2 type transport system permease protein